MNNRIQIFTESVAQLGVGQTELEALTKLFKVCLESAVELDDEENWEYATDTPEFDLSEDGVNSVEDDTPSLDEFGDSPDNVVDASSYRERWNRRDEEPSERPQDEPVESTLGTKLANAYIQIAPKLLHTNQCSPSDVDNLSKFIDWLIAKFNSFDPTRYMEQVTKQYNSNQSYDEARMDKILNVISVGTQVVQLLTDIKNTFGKELESASLMNEPSIFTAAKDINAFVADKFNVNGADFNGEQADPNIIYDDTGFIDVDKKDTSAPTEEQERIAAKPSQPNTSAKPTKKDSSPDTFSSDDDIDTVEKAVDDFINFVPTIELSDSEAADFNKPVDKTKKSSAKKIAEQRADYTKKHKGDVVEASTLNDDDDPWADL